MSILVKKFLVCERPGCAEPYFSDNWSKPIKQQRTEAKAEGWKRIEGRDYCQHCKPKPDVAAKEET